MVLFTIAWSLFFARGVCTMKSLSYYVNMGLVLGAVGYLSACIGGVGPYMYNGQNTQQHCGCGVGNDGMETFACLLEDEDGIAEVVVSGYCTSQYRCVVEPLSQPWGDDTLCVPR